MKYFRPTLYKIAIFTIIIQEENVICILLVCILQLAKKSITNKGCNLWNKLPENIKTVGSYNLFRKRLKQHYLELI